MRPSAIVLALGAGILATACRNAPPRPARTTVATAERSVFTDSVMHAQKCEPVRSGEDWRKICVPKDQALEIRRKP